MTDEQGSSRRGFLRVAGAAALGAVIGMQRPDAARAATGGLPVYDAQTYGAKGDGVADDTVAINAAIADAARTGGGVVYLPTGVYRVAPTPHPQDGSYAACLLMRRGVVLRGAGKEATTVRLADGAALPAGSNRIYLMLNAAINATLASASRDEGMAVEDLTVDGAAARQTALTCGIFWIGCRDVSHSRVRVRDMRGTGSTGGLAETFFYEFQLGAEASYSFCEAVTTAGGGGSTAGGFSADNATGLTYVSCVARGMTVSNGFTHNTCALLRYSDCHAYGNGMYGFNSENSEDVRYASCVAGGRADAAGQGVYTANQALGNVSAGFMVNGSRVVDLVGCSSRYNGGHGLWLAKEPDGARVSGGEYSNNGGWGILATSGATNVSIAHETRLANNTAGALQAQADLNTATPFLYDSGWITAAATTLTVSHGLPNRPRAITVYFGPGPGSAPADDTFVSTYPGPVFANNAQITVPTVAAGVAYRVVATY